MTMFGSASRAAGALSLARFALSTVLMFGKADSANVPRYVKAAVLWLFATWAGVATADPVADFYRGKHVTMIVSYGPGAGYDVYGRLVAKYMGRYIPGNPTVIVQNMPGAGSLKGANYIYNVAPRDGTAFVQTN